jgi:hypothetical protein
MIDRRAFFKRAAALGGAALALALGGRRTRPAPEAQNPPAPASRGYRLTAHVAKYYEKARG